MSSKLRHLGRSPLAIASALVLALVLVLAPAPARADDAKAPPVRASLVAETASIAPGGLAWVGVRLLLAPHWHVYWVNPGDSGLAVKVEWRLPEGFTAGPIQWPAPSRFEVEGIMSYGYSDEAVLLVPIRAPAGAAAGTRARLEAKLEWLVCSDTCIPGEATVALDLPLEAGAPLPSSEAPILAAARRRLPRPGAGWAAVIEKQSAAGITLRIEPPADLPLDDRVASAAYFFGALEGLIDSGKPQVVSKLEGGAARIALERSSVVKGEVDVLRGILEVKRLGTAAGALSREGREGVSSSRAEVIRVALEARPAGAAPSKGEAPPVPPEAIAPGDAPAATTGTGTSTGTGGGAGTGSGAGMIAPTGAPPASPFAVALSAFLGGLLLNLMPCVFPVLAIKVLTFVEQAGEDPGRARAHGSVFALGVVASFLALGGLLLLLRAAGNGLGWGFQLQSPIVVGALALLFFTIGLNFLGAFEIGEGVSGRFGAFASRKGYGGSFFSGALATAVATPCTAPFMGSALGYALLAPPREALLVFGALGLGMAAPYVALSSFPGLMRRLPRPGRWMVVLKELMAFPMFATTLWLAWVLGLQAGSDRVVLLFGGFLLIGLAVWWRRTVAPPDVEATLARRALGWAGTGIAAVAAVAIGLPWGDMAGATSADGGGDTTASGGGRSGSEIVWVKWSPEAVAAARRGQRSVYVDFTAAWCLTCQVNKKVVFASEQVRRRFQEQGVIAMKADWTNKDEAIARALEEHGRSGVPLNLVYPASGGEPEVLPAMLTPAVVLDALARAAPKGRS